MTGYGSVNLPSTGRSETPGEKLKEKERQSAGGENGGAPAYCVITGKELNFGAGQRRDAVASRSKRPENKSVATAGRCEACSVTPARRVAGEGGIDDERARHVGRKVASK